MRYECTSSPVRTRYKHIHVRSGSAFHGLTRSWKGKFYSCSSPSSRRLKSGPSLLVRSISIAATLVAPNMSTCLPGLCEAGRRAQAPRESLPRFIGCGFTACPGRQVDIFGAARSRDPKILEQESWQNPDFGSKLMECEKPATSSGRMPSIRCCSRSWICSRNQGRTAMFCTS